MTHLIHHIRSNVHFYLLFLLFFFAEVFINPLGEFPLIDDWSFAQTVKIFSESRKLDFGNYPAMTLFSQIVWGTVFTQLFGFSCITLRMSTFVSLWISLFLLYRLLIRFGMRKSLSVFAVSVLLFNPMVFLLGNTFMTDVNFNTLLILGIYAFYLYMDSGKWVYYLLFVMASIALLLLRQYGIILPFAYLAVCVFIRENRIRHWLLATANVVAVVFVLKVYESYLKHLLPEGSEYKFSGQVQVFSMSFWEKLFQTFQLRIGEILLQVLVMSSPVFLLFLGFLFRSFRWLSLLWMAIAASGITWFLFYIQNETSNCIFSNTIIGPETFYENFNGARHNVGNGFEKVYFYIKILLTFLSVFTGILFLFHQKRKIKQKGLQVFPVFLFLLFVFYLFMILITESYFDRYHIPLLTLAVLLLAQACIPSLHGEVRFALPVLCFFAFISIAGTHDYFEWNRNRWKAYWHLRTEKQIEAKKINGGLEVNCWREGQGTGWGDFLNISDFHYLIQFDEEPGFQLYKAYSFRRYLPYKIDKINIFVRDSLSKKYD